MDEFASTINQILGSKEGMEQLKTIAAALGLNLDNNIDTGGGNGTSATNYTQQAPPIQNTENGSQDIAALLSALMNNSPVPPPPQQNNSDIAALLSSLMANSGNSASNTNQNLDISSLLSGLMGASKAEQSTSSPNIDIGTMLKLQSALSLLSKEDNNTMLLKALRPHLSEARQKKVDDAIKIMQLIRLLPLVKELGLFGGDK